MKPNPNFFLEHAQTILAAKRDFCAISPLEFISKRVVSKRPCIETNGFLWDKMEPMTLADLSLVNMKHLE